MHDPYRKDVIVTAVLGVEQSLTAQRWVARETSDDIVAAIVRTGSVSETVARLLAGRGVAPENVDFYLTPTFRNHLPDPLILKQAGTAAERIAAAVMNGEKTAIFGDYDVDGATSSSLMYRFLRAVGVRDVLVRIPERDEGYGPTPEAFADFAAQGVGLIITVDCGTTAFDAMAAAGKTDVVVIDHHEPDASLPAVAALVNPKRLDEPLDHPCRNMAAVGVVFMVLIAVNRVLREKKWYSADRPEPDLRQWLDLVALGTVCDVVALRGLNRLFVKAGLNRMAQGGNAGIAAMGRVSKIKYPPTTYHLGFVFGPRLNACGRIGQSSLGARLLCEDDAAKAEEIALSLEKLNDARRELCEDVYKQAIGQIESKTQPQTIVFASGEGWHPGIVGIIAGRLKERYNLPALVAAVENGEARGSGRSVAGFDLGAAVLTAKEQGILTTGGGHTLAAGFSCKADKLDEFKAFLEKRFAAQASAETVNADYVVDSVIDIGAATWDLVQTLTAMEPFGEGNPEPRLAMADVAVASARTVGQGHVSCRFVGRNGRTSVRAIAYRAVDSAIGAALLNAKGRMFHVVGHLQADTFRGEGNVQFIIEDLAVAA